MQEEDPVHIKNLEAWYEADKQESLRFKYPLTSNSIVFDLGAFTGDWAIKIYDLYKCTVHCFEPVQHIFDELKLKTEAYPSIILHNFAVSNINEQRTIYINKDGSGFYLIDKSSPENVIVKSIIDIIKDLNINKIDLMKFNVEAEEYNILESMITNNLISIVDNFQIQFHRDVENYHERRINIQAALNKTHKLTYNFDYVWENWEKNNG